MIYLNHILPLGAIHPDAYQATSVADFLSNREEIRPLSLARRVSPFTWGRWYSPNISFANTNLRKKAGLLFLEDMTGEIVLDQDPKDFEPGRYSLIIARYLLKSDSMEVCMASKYSPPRPQKDFVSERQIRRAFGV